MGRGKLNWEATAAMLNGRKLGNVEQFKELAVWVPIGCSVNLDLNKFREWLDDIPVYQKPFVRFALFFQDGLSESEIKSFIDAVKHSFPGNTIYPRRGVTDREILEIISFCRKFNNEEEDDESV